MSDESTNPIEKYGALPYSWTKEFREKVKSSNLSMSRHYPKETFDFLHSHIADGSWDTAGQQLGLDGVFNKPWMENLNPNLLNRYWEKKGMSKPLILNVKGVKIRRVATPLGIIDTIERSPKWINIDIEKPYKPITGMHEEKL